MPIWSIFVIIFLFLVFFYLATGMILTFLLNRKIFGVRTNDPSHGVYVHFEDYPSLTRIPYETDFQGEEIRGYIYKDKEVTQKKGFIILSHGMFGSHVQYLVDVAYLTKAGYEVCCYDQYGVGLSSGESIVSLPHGILVLEKVIRDVEERNLSHGLDLILYGHSWGAYCSLGVLKNHPEIKKAVLRSGPCKPGLAGLRILYHQNRFLYYFLFPILPSCLKILSSSSATVDCTRKIKKNTSTEILVVYAKNDPMVDERNSQYRYFMKHPQKNVHLLLTEKGLHNSIITEESYHAFLSKAKEYREIESIPDETEKARRKEEFSSSLDRAKMVIYSKEVKEGILSFLS